MKATMLTTAAYNEPAESNQPPDGRSAQRTISAHSLRHTFSTTCASLQVSLYAATVNEIHEQRFTSVLPFLSLIIHLLSIKVGKFHPITGHQGPRAGVEI
jgi:hypothetical protein